MSIDTYSIGLSRFEDFRIRFNGPSDAIEVLRAWRNHHATASFCTVCGNALVFSSCKSQRVDGKHAEGGCFKRPRTVASPTNFTVCCERFHYRPTSCYVPESLAVRTPGYEFVLPCLKKNLEKCGIASDQEFLVLPDPIYWQVLSTLTYERALRFASGVPMTKKTQRVLPPSKASVFYKQVQEAPLNHGSLSKRSGGKNTFFRQIALGKRCELSARAMIVPDTDLKPNEISLPRRVAEQFGLEGQWVLLNRMPTLQPENFVALRVAKLWEHECFGIPLEILRQINGDFDGDECNIYIVRSPAAQAECELLLNSERNAGSTTLGLKLYPCQDMSVAYRHLLFEGKAGRGRELSKLFPKGMVLEPSLEDTMKAVYDLEGSKKTFDCFTDMTRLYLREMQDEWIFGLSRAEFVKLEKIARDCGSDFEKFRDRVDRLPKEEIGCLLFQIKARAKGSLYHAFQMFGSIGHRGESSFWKGLKQKEAVSHALVAFLGFKMSNNIWKSGYVFYKNCFFLQGLYTNYEGHLVDGERVIEKDASCPCHHTALMSDKGFFELYKQYFESSNERETQKSNDSGKRKLQKPPKRKNESIKRVINQSLNDFSSSPLRKIRR